MFLFLGNLCLYNFLYKPMPMDPAYKQLEKDNVEKRGAGRVWQEMAKNPAGPERG